MWSCFIFYTYTSHLRALSRHFSGCVYIVHKRGFAYEPKVAWDEGVQGMRWSRRMPPTCWHLSISCRICLGNRTLTTESGRVDSIYPVASTADRICAARFGGAHAEGKHRRVCVYIRIHIIYIYLPPSCKRKRWCPPGHC
jgi:hypothetical protein